MWNRFLPKSSSNRAKFIGASLTLGASAVLAVGCDSSTSSPATDGTGGHGNSTGTTGGNSSTGGSAPAQCAFTTCGGLCVDTKTNASNCGMCGMACPSTAPFCSNSTCSATCANTMCGTACVDTKTDVANCGGCNMPCATGQTCSAGMCMGVIGGTG